MVLVAAAGGQDHAIGKLLEERANGLSAEARVIEEVQAEFEERLASLGLMTGVVEEGWNVWKTQRDAYARERPDLRHLTLKESLEYHRGMGVPGRGGGCGRRCPDEVAGVAGSGDEEQNKRANPIPKTDIQGWNSFAGEYRPGDDPAA